jgi:hypothetical protein
MTRELIDIGDAMPFVPETVPEELPPPLDKDRINRILEKSDQDLAKSWEEFRKYRDSIGDKDPTDL